MDHDRLYKELLTVFFVEFVQLFLPDLAAYLDPTSLEFLDNEVFSDVTAGLAQLPKAPGIQSLPGGLSDSSWKCESRAAL